MAVTPEELNIVGVDKVLRNLNREVMKIRNRSKAGLWDALLPVKARSMELTPIKTGNLRGHTYLIPFDGPQGPAAEIGYTAAYAPYVHEIERYHHPVGQWKFLETALKENHKQILETIRRRVHVDTGRD